MENIAGCQKYLQIVKQFYNLCLAKADDSMPIRQII